MEQLYHTGMGIFKADRTRHMAGTVYPYRWWRPEQYTRVDSYMVMCNDIFSKMRVYV